MTARNRGNVGEADRESELLAGAAEVGSAPERRREELIEQAERDDGWSRDWAARVHDLAVEERVNPELGYLLVRTGFGVRDLPQVPADDETSIEGPPDWVEQSAAPSLEPELEGRIRRSFRRLRSMVERSDTLEGAIRDFLAEPDVTGRAFDG